MKLNAGLLSSRRIISACVAIGLSFSPHASQAQCCGGDGSGGNLPSLERFAHVGRLRLQVQPGTQKQFLEIYSQKTGERLATIPVGGTSPSSPSAPFGTSFPLPADGSPVLANLVDDPAVPDTGKDGIVQPASEDVAARDGETDCPDCKSGGAGTQSTSTGPIAVQGGTPPCNGSCAPVGTGTPEPSGPAAPDAPTSGGSSGNPVSPVPPNPTTPTPRPTPGSAGPGGGVPLPAPDLATALAQGVAQTLGGVHIPIAIGGGHAINFDRRFLNDIDSSDAKFRRYFSCTALGKLDSTAVQNPNRDGYAFTGFQLFPTQHGEILTDSDGIRCFYSHVSGNTIVGSLIKTTSDTWTLRVKYWSLMNVLGVTEHISLVNVSDPRFSESFEVTPGDPAPSIWIREISWTFKTSLVNGKKVLTATGGPDPTQIHTYGFWQETDVNGWLRTFAQIQDDGKIPVATEIIDYTNGSDLIRGEITHVGPIGGTDTKRSGWIMGTGPSYITQPTSTDPNVIWINFGGAGNMVWKWASNGMWEKTTVTPNFDAPVRQVEVLRPWGTTNASPLTATFANSHAIVDEITPVPMGHVQTRVVYISGQEISRSTDADVLYAISSGVVGSAHTHLTFPDGPNSMPIVSAKSKYAVDAKVPGAGRIKYRVGVDGTTEQTVYEAGTLTIPAPTQQNPSPEWDFDPANGPVGTGLGFALRATTTRTFLDGRKEKDVEIEDYDGILRVRESWVGEAELPLEQTRYTYDQGEVATIETRNTTSGPWRLVRSIQRGSDHGKLSDTEYDEAGVPTVTSQFNSSGNFPTLITRPALAAVNGLPAIPALTVEIAYDGAGRVISKTEKQGSTVLGKKAWTFDTLGRSKTITLNDAFVTEYVYADDVLGGQNLKKYKRAVADASPGTLVETTISDWRGEVVSRSGTSVVSESYSWSPLGNGHLRETHNIGPTAGAFFPLQRDLDGAGRVIGEKASVPSAQWRTYTYDPYGRIATESINSQSLHSWSYGFGDGMVTKTTTPVPDPTRTAVTQRSYVVDGNGALWESQADEFAESQTKLSGFAAHEIAVGRFKEIGGDWTTTTSTADPVSQTITTTTIRPGATDAAINISRAGMMQSSRPHSGVAAAIYAYDALGRAVQITENNGARTTTISYDTATATGEVASSTVSTTGGLTGTQNCVYYPAGNTSAGLLKAITTDGLTTYYTWTARGELRAQWGAVYPVRYAYDQAGRLSTMATYQTDPTGVTPPTSNPETWPTGNVTQWLYHSGTMALQYKRDAASQNTTYTYDPRGWLFRRTWARGTFTTYTFNRAGEIKTIDYSDTTPDVNFSRDDHARIAVVTDGAGGWQYKYDSQSRLERTVNTTSGNAMTHGRDSAGRRNGFSYWDQNASQWITWGGYGYDSATGRMNGVSTPEGWINQTFDIDGVWPDQSLNFGHSIVRNVTYDGLGRLSGVSATVDGNTPSPLASRTYGYNAQGQRNSATLGDGSYWSYEYNGRRELKTGAKKFSDNIAVGNMQFGTVGGTAGYTYDAIGNRTQLQRESNSHTRSFSSVNNPGTNGGSNSASIYVNGTADPAATVSVNSVAATRHGGDFWASISGGATSNFPKWVSINVQETKSGQTVAQNGFLFYLGTQVFADFDLDGNQIGDDHWIFTWDAENRLIAVETRFSTAYVPNLPQEKFTYQYDAYSRRTKKTTWALNAQSQWVAQKENRYAYDGINLIAEWEQALTPSPGAVSLVRTHYWGLDLSGLLQGAGSVGGLILTRHHQANGVVSSFAPAYDGAGNVAALIDTVSGLKAAEYEYGPFGEPLRATGPVAKVNPFRWSTKVTDDETGFSYYGYRYYDPGSARWLSRDPAGEGDLHNLSSFVGNDPLRYVDDVGMNRRSMFEELEGRTFEESMAERAAEHFARAQRLERIANQRRENERDRIRTDKISPRPAPNVPEASTAPECIEGSLDYSECTDDAGQKCHCGQMDEVRLVIQYMMDGFDKEKRGYGPVPDRWNDHTSLDYPAAPPAKGRAFAGFNPKDGIPERDFLDQLKADVGEPVPGSIHTDEAWKKYNTVRKFKACPITVGKLQSSIDQRQNDPFHPFNKRARNCVGWALERLQDAGFNPPLPPDTPGLWSGDVAKAGFPR